MEHLKKLIEESEQIRNGDLSSMLGKDINLGLPAEEEAKALNTLQKEEDEEACLACRGTGLADNYIFDENAKEWVLDGTKPCLCQIPHVEPEEINEVTN